MIDYKFKNIEWGPDESKGDLNLPKYFVQISEFNDIYNGDYRYIIGRKGCGKTAILQQIKYRVQNDPMAFCESVSLRNFPLAILRTLRDPSLANKSQYVPVWKFLITTEIAKMISNDNGIIQDDIKDEISNFIKQNFSENGGIVDTLNILRSNSNKVSISCSWLGLESGKQNDKEKMMTIHYQKAYDIIRNKLSMIKTESKYFIFFDELDEGYKAGDKNLRLLLLALIRAVEDVFIEFSEFTYKFVPLLALRTDIFDSLEDNDLNKLDDYIIRLHWSAVDKSEYCLKDIVNARICASLGIDYTDNAWDYVVDDSYGEKKSVWDYMCNQTFERPRDIIKYLKCCSKIIKDQDKLNFELLEPASYKYSDWFYNELRDEIHSELPVWKDALKCITQLGLGRFNCDQIIEIFKKDSNIINWVEEGKVFYESILECLFNYGVIGNLDVNNRWLFKYKDYDLDWSESKDIIVHFGFYKKLKLRNNRLSKYKNQDK